MDDMPYEMNLVNDATLFGDPVAPTATVPGQQEWPAQPQLDIGEQVALPQFDDRSRTVEEILISWYQDQGRPVPAPLQDVVLPQPQLDEASTVSNQQLPLPSAPQYMVPPHQPFFAPPQPFLGRRLPQQGRAARELVPAVQQAPPPPPPAAQAPQPAANGVAAQPAAANQGHQAKPTNRQGQVPGLPQALKQHKWRCNKGLGCQAHGPGFVCPLLTQFPERWHQKKAANKLWA